MAHILAPLKQAGISGLPITSGDGITRRGHPILASYVGDYPEQCLVTGAYQGECPTCDCPHDELGLYPWQHNLRDLNSVLDALEDIGKPQFAHSCREANIKPIQHPFWEDLPYVNIFQSITPDILHQLHQGVVKHLISWLNQACGKSEIDKRVQRLPPNHSIQNFKKGITYLSRVSGTEHRQISSFLLGLLIDIQLPGGVSSAPLIRATRALLDFLYLAQYPVHTTATLASLETALDDFHANKFVFVTLGIRDSFNIPKLHSLLHYIRAIKLFGTTDNYNTETTERLHIDFAKDAYQATNHKDEFSQMTKWLERHEKVMLHTNYISWRQMQNSSHPTEPSQSLPRSTWDPPDMACILHPKMTQHPTHKSVHLDQIISLECYGASNFVPAFARFVAQFRNPHLTTRQIEDEAIDVHLPFHDVAVFHKIKFWNEVVHGNETLDSIHAHPRVFNDGLEVKKARFDTALVQLKAIDSGNELPSIRGWFFFSNCDRSNIFPTVQGCVLVKSVSSSPSLSQVYQYFFHLATILPVI
jgi:Plavaka transposase